MPQTKRELRILSQAVAASSVGMILVDGLAPDLPIVSVNPAFTKITGYAPDEVLGRNCRFLQGPESGQPGIAALREAIAARRSLAVELRNYKKDGTAFWNEISVSPLFDEQGVLAQYVGYLRDVTDRVEAQAALRSSEARLQSIFAAVAEGIVVTDRTGTILEANRAAARLLGRSLDGLRGAKIEALVEWAGHAGASAAQRRAGEGRKALIRHENGNKLPVWVSTQDIQIGDRAHEVVVIRDLSIEERSEEYRVRLESKLKQSERGRILSIVVGGAAHEINNLLTPILLTSLNALDDAPPGSPLGDDLDLIARGARRVQQIVKNLRSQVLQEAVPKHTVELGAIVSEATSLARPLLARGVRLESAMTHGACLVIGDETQLIQCVMNLVINANDAIGHTGGLISVRIDRSEGPAGLANMIDPIASDSCWVLSVRDTGKGMDPATLKRAASPFFSTKSRDADGPRGLGLTIVHDIMRAHGGSFAIESALGQGTTVKLVFPVKADAGQGAASPGAGLGGGQAATGKTGPQVIVVDDEQEIVTAYLSTLKRRGYNAIGSTSAASALQAMAARDGNIDLAIIDLAMPEMPGHVLAERLRRIYPDMPIIVISARRSPDTDASLAAVGVTRILDKPLMPDELIAAVTEMMSSRSAGPAQSLPIRRLS